ncbi:hypothetical protein P3S68_028770 [Capsicum galapagoense]
MCGLTRGDSPGLLNAFKIILNTVLILQRSFREQYLTPSRKQQGFLFNINNILKEAVEAFYTKVQEIPCLTCPYKPEGAMCVMVNQMNLSFLEGINDDMEFCTKLAHEESVIILPEGDLI